MTFGLDVSGVDGHRAAVFASFAALGNDQLLRERIGLGNHRRLLAGLRCPSDACALNRRFSWDHDLFLPQHVLKKDAT